MAKEKRPTTSHKVVGLHHHYPIFIKIFSKTQHTKPNLFSLCLLLWFTPPVDCFCRSGYVILL